MPRNQIIGIDLLESSDDLLDVLVGERRYNMEAADHRVHFLDAGCDLRLPDRIDHAAMTTGGQHDEAFAFDDEVRSDLVLEIIGNEGAGVLCRRNFIGETPEPVDNPNFLVTWPQRFFET